MPQASLSYLSLGPTETLPDRRNPRRRRRVVERGWRVVGVPDRICRQGRGRRTQLCPPPLDALRSLGIKETDDLCVHSDVKALGFPAVQPEQMNGPLFLGVFEKVLQMSVCRGTLLMPTFTYSFCKGERFEVEKTPSTVGVLTEYFRNSAGTRRTGDPIFSFAVRGERAEEYIKISDICFGQDSVFDKLYQNGGKLLALGSPLRSSVTFVHYIENKAHVPYRYDKQFSGTIVSHGCEMQHTCTYFVRALDRPSIFREDILMKFLEDSDNLKVAPFGAGKLLLVDARRMCDDLSAVLRESPSFLLDSERK